MSANWEMLEFGLDYITLTEKRKGLFSELARVFKTGTASGTTANGERNEARRLGYTGEQAGKWFYGEREDGYMLQVSGSESGTCFELARALRVRCTRLDIQCTVRADRPVPMWGRQEVLLARGSRGSGRRGRPVTMPFIDGDGEGDTAYFGSRSSDRFGRLYDKALESRDPAYENCWRYEVEYKGDVGHATFAHLSAQSEYREAALQILVGQLGNWSIKLPVRETLCGTVLRLPNEETTIERQERWLLSQVLPTLARLVDSGNKDIVDRLFRQVYNQPQE